MEYAFAALGGGFIGALLTWHWHTSPRLNGDDFVSFRASTCGRDKSKREDGK
jgi:hypothetical protein